MGYADPVPNKNVMSKHQRFPRVVPILGSTDRHLAAAVLANARYRGWAGSGLLRTSVGLAAHHHGPDDAGHPRPAPGQALLASATAASFFGLRASNPRSHAGARPGLACWMTAVAPSTSSRRRLSSPSRLILPSRCLPAVEFSRGVMPIHAAKCRPERKRPSGPAPPPARGQALEREADAADRPNARDRRQTLARLIFPVPRHQPHLDRLQLGIQHLELARQHAEHLARQRRHALFGSHAPKQLGHLLWPPRFREGRLFGAVTPNSAAWPRRALISMVRCLTSRSRTLSIISAACRSAVLTGTNRIPGSRPTMRFVPVK